MSRSTSGRHELGQNFLADRRVAAEMARILKHAPPRPIVELGAGDGAITRELLRLTRPVVAVDIDPRRTATLLQLFPEYIGSRQLTVVHADALRFAPPLCEHDLISNVPFGITTPLLRRIMTQPDWQTAVLLVQWEVARKRAAVGGTTMLTALWWPWMEFTLERRVPARAFRPAPSVDGGVLVIRRRVTPLVAATERKSYQSLVTRVFTGRGLGLGEILRAVIPAARVRPWLAEVGLAAQQLPRDLDAENWADLWRQITDRSRKL